MVCKHSIPCGWVAPLVGILVGQAIMNLDHSQVICVPQAVDIVKEVDGLLEAWVLIYLI